MHSFLKYTLIACALLIMKTSSADVWKTENKYWNGNWEIKYQEWVAKSWKPDFFMRKEVPQYDQIPHDCADAIYLMRAVFSYENKLPFKISDSKKNEGYRKRTKRCVSGYKTGICHSAQGYHR